NAGCASSTRVRPARASAASADASIALVTACSVSTESSFTSRRRRVASPPDAGGDEACGVDQESEYITIAVSLMSMPRVRVAAAQLDLVVGDLEGNAARILDAYDRAEEAGADLVAFPELAITGYPPEDLLLRPAFVAQAVETLDKIAARTGRPAAISGFPEPDRYPC